MEGTNYSFQANHLAYTICSGNDAANFKAVEEAGESYENTNYIDFDNLTVSLKRSTAEDAVEYPYLKDDFSHAPLGKDLVKTDGYADAYSPYSRVIEEDGNRFLRLPLIYETAFNQDPHTKGKWIKFYHRAIPTTGSTSFKADFYLNGKSGNTPNVGLWFRNYSYTAADGTASGTKSYLRLFDVNLLTGELTFNGLNGSKLEGAKGMTQNAWNSVEIILEPTTGRYDLYINGALYAKLALNVAGATNFVIPANALMLCIDGGSNKADDFIAKADAGDNYENANSIDMDNLVVAPTKKAVDGVGSLWSYGFEDLAEGATTTLSGLTTAATVVTENGDKIIKIPFEGKKSDAADMINIDKNAYVNNPAINYVSMPRLVIEENFFIPPEHTGGFDIRFGSATVKDFYPTKAEFTAPANGVISWLTLCRVNYTTAGSTANLTAGNSNIVGATVNNVIKKGEWVNVAADIDMVNGTYDLYVDGALALADVAFIGQWRDANKVWHTGTINGLSLPANKFICVSPFNNNNASKDNYVLVDDISWHTFGMATEIDGATVSLGEDLSVNYYVDAGKSVQLNGDLSMQFTVNGQTVTVSDYATVGDKYVFTLAGIAPQQMGDSIDAVLYAGNRAIAEHKGYSIKKNLTNLLAKTPAELGMTVEKYRAMKTLISDLLSYGAAAQAYKSYGDAPVTNGVTGLASSARIPAAGQELTLSGVGDAALRFTSATVRFDTVNSIRIKIYADEARAENATVTVNGETKALTELVALGNGTYLLEIKGIDALSFAKRYTVTLCEGETTVTLSYSVNAYALAMCEGDAADAMKTLALSLYRYGMSAEKYAAEN